MNRKNLRRTALAAVILAALAWCHRRDAGLEKPATIGLERSLFPTSGRVRPYLSAAASTPGPMQARTTVAPGPAGPPGRRRALRPEAAAPPPPPPVDADARGASASRPALEAVSFSRTVPDPAGAAFFDGGRAGADGVRRDPGAVAGPIAGEVLDIPAVEAQTALPRESFMSGMQQMKSSTIRQQEPRITTVWLKYWNQSEVVRQYEKDWFEHKDLALLTDNYDRDHNPVAFAKGLAASSNFRPLAAKYARQPVMLALMRDVIAAATMDAIWEAGGVLRGDGQLRSFAKEIDGQVRETTDGSYSPVKQAFPPPPPSQNRGPALEKALRLLRL